MNQITARTEYPTPSVMSSMEIMTNEAVFHQIDRIANLMASGKSTVPKHLQGSPGDCFAISMQAMQWGMNPFAVAQKTHLVNGTLGYEAQLVNAVISSSRAIVGRFKYEYGGDWSKENDPSAWVRVGAQLAGDDQITWGEPLYVSKITTKNSPLWKTAPKQQAAYLAVKYWSRMYTPDVILGVYTPDELDNTMPKDMGMAQQVHGQAAESANAEILPHYESDEAFQRDLTKWRTAVAKGKVKSMQDALERTRTRYTLTQEQEAQFMSEAAPVRPDVHDVQDATPKTVSASFDQIVDAINQAQNFDELEHVSHLIPQVKDEAEAARLIDLFNAKEEAFPPFE